MKQGLQAWDVELQKRARKKADQEAERNRRHR